MESRTISIFVSRSDIQPRHIEVSGLAELHEKFPHVARETKDGPLWSPARYQDGTTRAKTNVRDLSFLAIDLDGLTEDEAIEQVGRVEAMGLEYWAHSTWSHTPQSPCLRIVLALSRPVPASEWPRFWLAATQAVAPLRDGATCDASRFYYLPSCPDEQLVWSLSEYAGGVPLDVDEVLRKADVGGRGRPLVQEEEAPSDEKAVTPEMREWALRQVDRFAREIRTRPMPGPIHPTINRAAYALGGLVRSGCLERALVRDELRKACLDRNPDVNRDKDIDDGLRDGATAPWTPAPWYPLTDAGIARRIVEKHGEHIRYVFEWKSWIGWDDELNVWSRHLGESAVKEAIANTAQALIEEAEYRSEKRAKELKGRARVLGSASGVRAVMWMLERERALSIESKSIDANPWLLGTPDKLIDLEKDHRDLHDPAKYVMRRTSVNPAYGTKAPAWERFLREIMCGDEELVGFLKRAVGYSITGVVDRPHKMFFLYGDGCNGKGVFVRTLSKILGDYAVSPNHEILMAKKHETHPTSIANLYRRRFAAISEVDEGRGWDEGAVKRLVDSGKITARRMYENDWEFEPTHHFWISGNYKPTVRGVDPAIWRRLILIPFEASFRHRQDPTLEKRLEREGPAILAWAIEGCAEWKRDGILVVPSRLEQATEDYKDENDTVKQFVEETYTQVDKDKRGVGVKSSHLFQSWAVWCGQQGLRAMDLKWLAKRLEPRFARKEKRSDGAYWVGLEHKRQHP